MQMNRLIGLLLAVAATGVALEAGALAPAGQIKGSQTVHTPESGQLAIRQAALVLPAAATGGAVFVGKVADAPTTIAARVPVVVFLHGSSGLGLKAIGEWQRWLADLGVASLAPDSFALPDRLTYQSPIDKAVYERVHALRQSEIDLALAAVRTAPWADPARLVLSGTSEGSVAVARHAGDAFIGRMVYAWSCEDNYFVEQHRSALSAERPVLNVISTRDPYFSSANEWVGLPAPAGHCGPKLGKHPLSSVVLIPEAPHTLLNLPAARRATEGFLRDLKLVGH